LQFNDATANSIRINASEKIEIQGFYPATLFTTLFPFVPFRSDSDEVSSIASLNFSRSDGESLEILTEKLLIGRGGNISAIAFNEGKGSDITIDARNIEMIGKSPQFFPSVINITTQGIGNTGDLNINTDRLTLRNGARINSATFAEGKAGNVFINANQSIDISGTFPGSINPSLIDSSATILDESLRNIFELPPTPSGEAGNLIINTPRLKIADEASVTVRNDGTGDAGTLSINAPSLFLDSTGSISATTASGRGGNIFINSSDLRLNDNSSVTATAGGTGDGGNITINTDTLVGLDNSSITANAFEGRGGNIEIATRALFFSPDSSITATSQLGVDGTVQIEILQPLQQEPVAPSPTITTEQLLSQSCLNRTEIRGTFNYVGNEGIPLTPESGFDRSGAAIQIPKPNPEEISEYDDLVVANRKRPWEIGDPVVEPNQEVKTPDGRIMLVTAQISSSPVSVDELICKPVTQPGK
jgi:large exoprotein involved in heme utilization and adhesion